MQPLGRAWYVLNMHKRCLLLALLAHEYSLEEGLSMFGKPFLAQSLHGEEWGLKSVRFCM